MFKITNVIQTIFALQDTHCTCLLRLINSRIIADIDDKAGLFLLWFVCSNVMT